MKILVTNDDGISARGLWELVKELMESNEVIVVAPDREQSAVGTSVTLHQPLRVRSATPPVSGIETYSVEGTPADSVILALGTLIKGGIDLVVSGINEGANLGNDVLISGTVGAALQGHFHGIPAIALAVNAIENPHFDVAAKLAALLAGRIAANELPSTILLNVNLPDLPLDSIGGIEVTKLAKSHYVDEVQEGRDGKRKYYWIVRGQSKWNADDRTDIRTIEKGNISFTPLRSDLTSHPPLPTLEDICLDLFRQLHNSNR